ncbi:MAG TPA: histidine phosphatase family protein [Gaiellaceae bacterium]|jgi:broad specificity phosphatase PhoE|nr:histidine phosphatase family protein [Gaiellaceae bacterium]
MRLFLVARHGQSLFNVDSVVNGDPELDRGLSEQGIEEAERLAGQLAGLPLDLVAVSPFPRALQTANIAIAGREVRHLVDDDLGDVRIGELEGKSLDAYRETSAHSNRKERFPGGESLDEAALRYAAAMRRLLARDEPATLVVCHEIPVRYLVNAAGGSDELNGPLRFVANATPYLFGEAALQRAAERIGELAG